MTFNNYETTGNETAIDISEKTRNFLEYIFNIHKVFSATRVHSINHIVISRNITHTATARFYLIQKSTRLAVFLNQDRKLYASIRIRQPYPIRPRV